jgi:CBS domain-containing protein
MTERQALQEARLTMQIRDIMMSVVGHVDVDTSLRDATATMKSLRLDPIPVLDHGKLVGLLSERDILAIIARYGVGGGMQPARHVMQTQVLYCRPDQGVSDALDALKSAPKEARIERLPVVDAQQRLVGMVLGSALVRGDAEQSDELHSAYASKRLAEETDYGADPVLYMSEESFPASDTVPPPSSLGRDEDD